MYYAKLRKGLLRKLIFRAVKKAGSERKLSKITRIPSSCFYHYKKEKRSITCARLKKIVSFLNLRFDGIEIVEKLPENWGRRKGGKSCFSSKKDNGTWDKNLEKMKKSSSIRMKQWHADLKKNDPKKYYNLQYNNFKKIAGYKCITLRGEKVRNVLEKKIADFLYSLGIDYRYETLVKGKRGYYFPDFLIGEVIIECTMWRGVAKTHSLKRKFEDLKQAGFTMILFIPKNLRHDYKLLEEYIITELDDLKDKCLGSSVSSQAELKTWEAER